MRGTDDPPEVFANAVAEALRFLRLAKDFDRAFKAKGNQPAWPLPERAAMKRASMDLTRALARLRRPNAIG